MTDINPWLRGTQETVGWQIVLLKQFSSKLAVGGGSTRRRCWLQIRWEE